MDKIVITTEYLRKLCRYEMTIKEFGEMSGWHLDLDPEAFYPVCLDDIEVALENLMKARVDNNDFCYYAEFFTREEVQKATGIDIASNEWWVSQDSRKLPLTEREMLDFVLSRLWDDGYLEFSLGNVYLYDEEYWFPQEGLLFDLAECIRYCKADMGKPVEKHRFAAPVMKSYVDYFQHSLNIEPPMTESEKTLLTKFKRFLNSDDMDTIIAMAEEGYMSAQRTLAWRYMQGRVVERDEEKANYWFRKAAEQGDTESQVLFADRAWWLRLEDNLEIISADEAIKWYRCAAERGDPDALQRLARLYVEGRYTGKNYKEALKCYRRLAEWHMSWDERNLGLIYYEGKITDADYTEALKWFRKAAEFEMPDGGDPLAELMIGMCYYNGNGVEQDYQEALKHFRNLEERYIYPGINMIGECYLNGNGVEKDENKAFEYFKEAAYDDDRGMYNVAMCYEEGIGTKKDISEAISWYKKAGKRGCKEAIERLIKYYKDDGHNPEELMVWQNAPVKDTLVEW